MKREELNLCLNQQDDAIMEHVRSKLAKGHFRDVQQISSGLRRQGRLEIAERVTDALYAQNPHELNPYSLNWYFAAVVDEGNADKIKEADKAVAERVKDPQTSPEQRKHLYATRLKAANRIQDDKKFEEIYGEIPAEDKTGNNYIAGQYFDYLNRNKRYQEIVAYYDALSPALQGNEGIQERYNDALNKVKMTGKNQSAFLIGSNLSELLSAGWMLQSIPNIRVIKITGKNQTEILNNMEADKSGSRFAVVCGTEFDEFAWGYFFGKIGASNLVIFTNDDNAENAIPCGDFQKPAVLKATSGDLESLNGLTKKLAELMKKSGLSVSLE